MLPASHKASQNTVAKALDAETLCEGGYAGLETTADKQTKSNDTWRTSWQIALLRKDGLFLYIAQ